MIQRQDGRGRGGPGGNTDVAKEISNDYDTAPPLEKETSSGMSQERRTDIKEIIDAEEVASVETVEGRADVKVPEINEGEIEDVFEMVDNSGDDIKMDPPGPCEVCNNCNENCGAKATVAPVNDTPEITEEFKESQKENATVTAEKTDNKENINATNQEKLNDAESLIFNNPDTNTLETDKTSNVFEVIDNTGDDFKMDPPGPCEVCNNCNENCGAKATVAPVNDTPEVTEEFKKSQKENATTIAEKTDKKETLNATNEEKLIDAESLIFDNQDTLEIDETPDIFEVIDNTGDDFKMDPPGPCEVCNNCNENCGAKATVAPVNDTPEVTEEFKKSQKENATTIAEKTDKKETLNATNEEKLIDAESLIFDNQDTLEIDETPDIFEVVDNTGDDFKMDPPGPCEVCNNCNENCGAKATVAPVNDTPEVTEEFKKSQKENATTIAEKTDKKETLNATNEEKLIDAESLIFDNQDTLEIDETPDIFEVVDNTGDDFKMDPPGPCEVCNNCNENCGAKATVAPVNDTPEVTEEFKKSQKENATAITEKTDKQQNLSIENNDDLLKIIDGLVNEIKVSSTTLTNMTTTENPISLAPSLAQITRLTNESVTVGNTELVNRLLNDNLEKAAANKLAEKVVVSTLTNTNPNIAVNRLPQAMAVQRIGEIVSSNRQILASNISDRVVMSDGQSTAIALVNRVKAEKIVVQIGDNLQSLSKVANDRVRGLAKNVENLLKLVSIKDRSSESNNLGGTSRVNIDNKQRLANSSELASKILDAINFENGVDTKQLRDLIEGVQNLSDAQLQSLKDKIESGINENLSQEQLNELIQNELNQMHSAEVNEMISNIAVNLSLEMSLEELKLALKEGLDKSLVGELTDSELDDLSAKIKEALEAGATQEEIENLILEELNKIMDRRNEYQLSEQALTDIAEAIMNKLSTESTLKEIETLLKEVLDEKLLSKLTDTELEELSAKIKEALEAGATQEEIEQLLSQELNKILSNSKLFNLSEQAIANIVSGILNELSANSSLEEIELKLKELFEKEGIEELDSLSLEELTIKIKSALETGATQEEIQKLIAEHLEELNALAKNSPVLKGLNKSIDGLLELINSDILVKLVENFTADMKVADIALMLKKSLDIELPDILIDLLSVEIEKLLQDGATLEEIQKLIAKFVKKQKELLRELSLDIDLKISKMSETQRIETLATALNELRMAIINGKDFGTMEFMLKIELIVKLLAANNSISNLELQNLLLLISQLKKKLKKGKKGLAEEETGELLEEDLTAEIAELLNALAELDEIDLEDLEFKQGQSKEESPEKEVESEEKETKVMTSGAHKGPGTDVEVELMQEVSQGSYLDDDFYDLPDNDDDD